MAMVLLAPPQVVPTQKQRYQIMRRRIEHVTDGLGRRIDRGIIEPVVYLNLLGYQTEQSCIGHLDHGCPYPWISVVRPWVSPEAEAQWRDICSRLILAQREQTEEAYTRYMEASIALSLSSPRWKRDDILFSRLTLLLDTFYQEREPSPVRLMVFRVFPGSYRVESGSGRILKERLPASLKPVFLRQAREEMWQFTAFLKEQYWHSSDSYQAVR